MTLEHLNAPPAFLPIPESDCHIIGCGQDKGLRRMDYNRPDVVWVGFERCYLLGGVVIVNAKLKVIRATDDPVLAGNKAAGSYRDIGEFEGFDD